MPVIITREYQTSIQTNIEISNDKLRALVSKSDLGVDASQCDLQISEKRSLGRKQDVVIFTVNGAGPYSLRSLKTPSKISEFNYCRRAKPLWAEVPQVYYLDKTAGEAITEWVQGAPIALFDTDLQPPKPTLSEISNIFESLTRLHCHISTRFSPVDEQPSMEREQTFLLNRISRQHIGDTVIANYSRIFPKLDEAARLSFVSPKLLERVRGLSKLAELFLVSKRDVISSVDCF